MKNRFISLGLLAAFVSLAFLSTNTSAVDNNSQTEWGGRDISFYSGDVGYHSSISGATWYYYQIQGGNYTDDERLYVPFDETYTDKVAIPAKTCQSYGGFWVLMRNEYKRDPNDDTKGTLTNRPAGAIKLSDVYDKDNMVWPATSRIDYKDRTGTFDDNNGAGVSAGYYDSSTSSYGTLPEVFKAYDSLRGTTAIPDGANWQDGNISYFCAGSNNSNPTAEFESFSTVSVDEDYTSAPVMNGQGYLSNSLVVPAGSTVKITFRHYISKAVAEALSEANIPYTVSGYNGYSASGNISTRDLTERYRFGEANYYAGVVEHEIEVPATAYTYCESATFNNDNNGLQYQLKDFQVVSGGNHSKASSACVTIKPIISSPEVVSDCNYHKDGDLMIGNRVLGNTAATVGISKNGVLSSDAISTAAAKDTTVRVYTKPGDVVQFSYALCFGAHNVGGDLTGNTNRNNISNIQWNTFEVYSGLAGSPDESQEYLFGRAEELFGQRIYVLNYDIRNSNIAQKSLLKGGSLNSPVNDSMYYNIDNTKRQISFASPDDWPGTAGYAPVLVGATLSQTLEYSNVAVWPEYLSRGSSTVGPFTKGEVPWGWGKLKRRADQTEYNRAYEAYQSGYRTPSEGYLFNDELVYKTASAITPYNFKTNVSAEINGYESGTVQSGDIVTVSANVDILPRVNPLTSDKNDSGELIPYATATPTKTKVELIEFLIRDTVDINNEYTYNDGSVEHRATLKQILNGEIDRFEKNTICNLFKGYLGDDLGECTSETIKGDSNSVYEESERVVGNADSNPEGEMGYYHSEGDQLARVVPDVEAGYKYCVAVGINHGDSHNNPDGELYDLEGLRRLTGNSSLTESEASTDVRYAANVYSVSPTLNTAVKATWNVSPVSCRTVTKSPNFQIWNSGVYSSGDIVSSVTKSTVNTKITSNHLQSDETVKVERRATNSAYFGSWAEYFVVSKGSVVGFASASALGYTTPFDWFETDENGNRTYHTDYFAATGFGGKTVLKGNCDLAHLTIANAFSSASCATGAENGNYSSGNADEAALASYKQRIINYYTDRTLTNGSGVIIGDSTQSAINALGDSVYTAQNGASYLRILGNYTVDTPIIRPQNAGTLVIEVTGHLFIDQNVCLGSGFCNDSSSSDWQSVYDQNTNDLSLSGRNIFSITSVSDLMNLGQIIFVAKDISISSEVSQIDAWLITDSTDNFYDGGYINTCKEFQSNTTDTSTCWKTLKFNGPVLTAALFLNRTGGAWPGYAGDVGNPAYEVLSAEMSAWTKQRIAEVLSNPNDSIYREAEEQCSKRRDTKSCIETKVSNLVKEIFLTYRVTSDWSERTEAERKAYENADNFSANRASVSVGNSASRDLTCDGSITPAEIFDLNPITYLWAYGQALKSSQAVVTYAQELSPRY